MNEVKTCPFCGSEVRVTKGLINAPFWFFKCANPKCGAIVSFDNMDANLRPRAALKYFNNRTKGGTIDGKK